MYLFNDGIEDTAHFLLLYHEHSTKRGPFLDKASDISLFYDLNIYSLNENDLLLLLRYGNTKFGEISDKHKLLETIKYITATNRFALIC